MQQHARRADVRLLLCSLHSTLITQTPLLYTVALLDVTIVNSRGLSHL
jgi:hypothetical protein